MSQLGVVNRNQVLTVVGVGAGNHDTQIGRGAGARDDGGAEEAGGGAGQLAARAQPQHLEVAHLAGDAVPLAPPCAPPRTAGRPVPAPALGRGQVRPRGHTARSRRAAAPERDRGQRKLVSGGLDAVHVNHGGLRARARTGHEAGRRRQR